MRKYLIIVFLLAFGFINIFASLVDAKKFVLRGKYRKAITLLRKDIKKGKGTFEHFLTLGNASFYIMNIKSAKDAYSKAIEKNSDSKEALSNLASCYTVEGKYSKAMLLFKKILRINKNDPDTYRNLAMAQLFSDELEDAENSINKSLNKFPDNTDYMLVKAEILEAKGKENQAEEIYNKVLANGSPMDKVTANINLAKIFLKKGVLRKAKSAVRNALELNPNNADAHEILGDIYWRNSNIEMAVYEFRTSLAFNPAQDGALYKIGTIYKKSGNLDKAISFLERAENANPTSIQIKSTLAEIYFQRNKYYDAKMILKDALNIAPKNLRSLTSLSKAYRLLGDKKQAKLILDSVFVFDAEYVPARIEKAIVFYFKDEVDTAKALLKNILVDYPFDLESNYYISKIWMSENKPDSAILHLQECVSADYGGLDVNFILSNAYLLSGNEKKGLKLLRKLLKSHSENSLVMFKLAEYIYKSSNKAHYLEAKDLYDKCITLSPNFKYKRELEEHRTLIIKRL